MNYAAAEDLTNQPTMPDSTPAEPIVEPALKEVPKPKTPSQEELDHWESERLSTGV